MAWEWQIGRNGYKHLMSGDAYILSPESDLGDYGLSCIEWCDVSDEHARLIAAAPELLAALQAVDLARTTDAAKDWKRATLLTDAAIAKATQP